MSLARVLSVSAIASVLLGATLVEAGVANKRFMSCSDDAAVLDDCDINAYLLRVGLYVVPGVLLGVLILICCPLYTCGRFICNCCGGRMPSHNFCCACGSESPTYGTGERFRPKLYMLIIMIAAFVAVPWALAGAGTAVVGMTDLTSGIKRIPDAVGFLIDEIHTNLITQEYDLTTDRELVLDLFELGGLVNSTATIKDDLEKEIDDALGGVQDNIDQFSELMFFLIVIPLGIIVVGAFAALCNIRHCIPTLLLLLMFLFAAIVWILHGAFGAFGLLFSDLCVEVQSLVELRNNAITAVAGCSDETFTTFLEAFKGIEETRTLITCTAMTAVCYIQSVPAEINAIAGTVFICPDMPANTDCDSMTFDQMTDYVQGMTINASIVGVANAKDYGYICNDGTACSLELCADVDTGCSNSTVDGLKLSMPGRVAKQIMFLAKATETSTKSRETLGARFASCNGLLSIVFGPTESGCTGTALGFRLLQAASGLEGLGCCLFMIVMAWGSKRFVSADTLDEIKQERDDENANNAPDEQY